MNIFRSRIFYVICTLFIGLVIGSVFLYFTDEGVATEFRQIQQPKPNRFYIGIDVSATIDPDTLADFKNNVTERLKNFIGDQAVSYQIDSFGNPGCERNSVRRVVSTESPKDDKAFKRDVESKIQRVAIAQIPPSGRTSAPLTTPLNYLLGEDILPKWEGGRILIFSDLMNDDSDCPRQNPFPEEAIKNFGKNKEGQIIFLYPTPQLTNNPELDERIMAKQREFITRMESLRSDGHIRVFFYHIPEIPEDRSSFMHSQLQNAIPTTMFEIIWERASRVVDTMVSAVRG